LLEAAFCLPLRPFARVGAIGGGIERGGAGSGSILGTTRGAETVAGNPSESESEITITSLSHGLEAREDAARDGGMNEARLLGRDPAREKTELALDEAREPKEDPARDGARELKGVEF
jgi:hypothetical protein